MKYDVYLMRAHAWVRDVEGDDENDAIANCDFSKMVNGVDLGPWSYLVLKVVDEEGTVRGARSKRKGNVRNPET
jgi:hypothetical protein